MTLPMEVVANIRRLHFAEQWTVGTIAAQLGVHHEAVERALVAGGDTVAACRVPTSILDAYKPLIRETLERYPRLTATRVFHMVKSRGYAGGYVTVKRCTTTSSPWCWSATVLLSALVEGSEAEIDPAEWWAGGLQRDARPSTSRILACHAG